MGKELKMVAFFSDPKGSRALVERRGQLVKSVSTTILKKKEKSFFFGFLIGKQRFVCVVEAIGFGKRVLLLAL